ncbi:hypothetical protein HDU98_011941 [Podochytrium sp. JEL0797]|nr:hypothetical protein HDU98_011941 [Podochytrium sp. JEL0797]
MGNAPSLLGDLIDWSSSDKLTRAKTHRDAATASHARAAELAAASQFAFKRGDGAEAKRLSDAKKAAQQQAAEANLRARVLIVAHFNDSRPLAEIDLHGLFVQEAKDVLTERIAACRAQNVERLAVITGKGNHSANGPRIKPMVIEFCRELDLECEMGTNEGCVTLILSKPGDQSGTWCVIM